jgi:hypothetical protein
MFVEMLFHEYTHARPVTSLHKSGQKTRKIRLYKYQKVQKITTNTKTS